jgi:hypothetical protein
MVDSFVEIDDVRVKIDLDGHEADKGGSLGSLFRRWYVLRGLLQGTAKPGEIGVSGVEDECEEVLERVDAIDAERTRTGLDGDVWFKVEKEEIKVGEGEATLTEGIDLSKGVDRSERDRGRSIVGQKGLIELVSSCRSLLGAGLGPVSVRVLELERDRETDEGTSCPLRLRGRDVVK